ncbi:hypothetical protein LK996_08620 [Lysobacter sp. A6]|uniref:Uncharacterized protein n=1 Tax=Noviluteimonas lactosilytica TaxID=2888523 RepID=A0ABS8JHT7_9GAMM|nr:hypothetical protein [Lysobacter lactosilyticus]MCC8363137.1 hypothetical protein [Lysobacter lactosilyticus]
MNDTTPDLQLLGALALELAPGTHAEREALPQADAGALAQRMAQDLAGFASEADALQLVTVGAHYDVVELLRPGWSLHRELDQLAARAPGDASGRVIAFGAHDDKLPGALTPQPEHAGGPLRLVPFVLGGDGAIAARVGDVFERDLMERGMAGAATALLAQDAFGMRVEHARYLTLHDLAAMMALQYEHAGLAPLWPVVEAALLEPDAEEWLESGPEPVVHYADREARIALFTPQAWRERYAAQAAHETTSECDKLERAFEHFQARQRQFAAVLEAHGIPVTFVHCDKDNDAHAELA